MSRVAIPLDSVAVVAERWDEAANAVWSEELARVVAEHLSVSGDLRVVPHARVVAWARSGDYSPEEVARHFNARAALHCKVAVRGDDLDVHVAVIDAFAESVMCETAYLVSVDEAICVQEQILRWIGRCCFRVVSSPAPRDVQSYVREIRARALCREGRLAEALDALRALAPRGLSTFAEVIVDAPSRLFDEDLIALAGRSVSHAGDLVAARLVCRFTRDWERADDAFSHAVARNSDPAAHAHYGLFLAATRRFEEAEAELRVAAELSDPTMPERALIERGRAYCGRDGRAAIVDDDRYADAIACAEREETDAAIDALHDAASQYSPYAMFTAVDPAFLPLRRERRFAEVVRRLGLR